MAEGETFQQYKNRERWCMKKVPEGKEKWAKNASWHPLKGYCKARGKVKVGGEWRCAAHAPERPPAAVQVAMDLGASTAMVKP